jgi:hypothetical protein
MACNINKGVTTSTKGNKLTITINPAIVCQACAAMALVQLAQQLTALAQQPAATAYVLPPNNSIN